MTAKIKKNINSVLRYVYNYINTHYLLASVGAGLFLGIGFVFPSLWGLSFLGFVIFLFLIDNCKSATQAFWVGWITTTFLLSCSLSWGWSIYPVDWLPFTKPVWEIIGILIYWLSSSLVIGLSGGIFALLVWFLSYYKKVYLLTIPFLWVGREILGSFLFSLMMLGSGSGLNIKFSFGYLGYLLAEHNLLFSVSAWGGVYSLSFLYTLLAVFLYWWIKNARAYGDWVVAILLILFLTVTHIGYKSVTWSHQTEIEHGKEILVVETDFSDLVITGQTRKKLQPILFHKLFKEINTKIPEYILLPEGSEYISSYGNNLVARSQLQKLFPENNLTTLLDSGAVQTDNGEVVQATWYRNQDRTFTTLGKRYLVPQGEYLPYLHEQVLQLALTDQVMQDIQERFSYTAATDSSSYVTNNNPPVLFCFESTDPQSVRNLVATEGGGRPPFLVHIISHGWFHEPKVLWHQLDSMLRVQSSWNQVTIISVANEAPSKLYTPQGKVYSIEDIAHTVYDDIPHLKAMQFSL